MTNKCSELEETYIISDVIILSDSDFSIMLLTCVDMNKCMNVKLMFGWYLYKTSWKSSNITTKSLHSFRETAID